MLKLGNLQKKWLDGIDHEIDFGESGKCTFVLAVGGVRYMKRLAELEDAARRERGTPAGEALPQFLMVEIMKRAAVGTTIMGWRTPILALVEGEDGQPVERELRSHRDDGSLDEEAFLLLLNLPPIADELGAKIKEISADDKETRKGKGKRSSKSSAGG